jgi:hypothetical protein
LVIDGKLNRSDRTTTSGIATMRHSFRLDNGTKSRAATMSKANGVDRDENSPANDQPSCMSQAGGAVSLLPGSANRPLGGGAPLQARTGAQRGDTLTFLLIFIKFTMANIFSFGITLRIERI